MKMEKLGQRRLDWSSTTLLRWIRATRGHFLADFFIHGMERRGREGEEGEKRDKRLIRERRERRGRGAD